MEKCDRCRCDITREEIAKGWPVCVGDEYICPSCYGDEAFCSDCGETLRADDEQDRCECCERKREPSVRETRELYEVDHGNVDDEPM